MGIYATLHTTPTKCGHAHEMIYITRGASAELVYSLHDKVFNFKDIEQITFVLKQGKTIYWYSMFESSDETGIKINPQFYHFDNPEYAAIILNLNSNDTKQFKPGLLVEYEVTIKLNTDKFESLSNMDSIIIEPQHSIAVVDSLYSRIEEEQADVKK